MQIAIIGSGPTGMFLGAALARRGHHVTSVDRDPGPDRAAPEHAADGWERRGVMQFHHAHGFRGQVADALQAEIPEAYAGWLAAGATPITMTSPDGTELTGAVRSRRSTFERALRASVTGQDGLTLLAGHVDEVTTADGRACGLRVGDRHVPAELVIDASGRSGRATRALRPTPTVIGETGIAYVDRQYQLRPGAEPGPLTGPIAWQADLDGYQVIIFPHEHGIFSVLIVRPTDDANLVHLRHAPAFEAACRAIPGLSSWTDPARSRPITPVLPGGALVSRYLGQAGHDGGPALRGLIFAGDAVCTTTPMFGRGITTSLLQARELLRLLDEHGTDTDSATEAFDSWCAAQMCPWVEDHVRMDTATRARWAGTDIDLTMRLPSDLIMAAAAVDPGIGRALGPYMSMQGGPASLDGVEQAAKAVYRTGWRPPPADGPDRVELAAVIHNALATV